MRPRHIKTWFLMVLGLGLTLSQQNCGPVNPWGSSSNGEVYDGRPRGWGFNPDGISFKPFSCVVELDGRNISFDIAVDTPEKQILNLKVQDGKSIDVEIMEEDFSGLHLTRAVDLGDGLLLDGLSLDQAHSAVTALFRNKGSDHVRSRGKYCNR